MRVQPFQPQAKWELGKVTQSLGCRSYEIEMNSGAVLRRNRKHLRLAHGVFPAEPVDIEMASTPDTTSDTTLPQLHHSGNDVCDSNELIATRRGRVIRKPQRYNDFAT